MATTVAGWLTSPLASVVFVLAAAISFVLVVLGDRKQMTPLYTNTLFAVASFMGPAVMLVFMKVWAVGTVVLVASVVANVAARAVLNRLDPVQPALRKAKLS